MALLFSLLTLAKGELCTLFLGCAEYGVYESADAIGVITSNLNIFICKSCLLINKWLRLVCHNLCMMTSSNGNIFRVTGHLCGEFTGLRWIPPPPPHKGQWRGAFMFSLICVWINRWVNNREAGDLRRYRAHYDVIVMYDVQVPIA